MYWKAAYKISLQFFTFFILFPHQKKFYFFRPPNYYNEASSDIHNEQILHIAHSHARALNAQHIILGATLAHGLLNQRYFFSVTLTRCLAASRTMLSHRVSISRPATNRSVTVSAVFSQLIQTSKGKTNPGKTSWKYHQHFFLDTWENISIREEILYVILCVIESINNTGRWSL